MDIARDESSTPLRSRIASRGRFSSRDLSEEDGDLQARMRLHERLMDAELRYLADARAVTRLEKELDSARIGVIESRLRLHRLRKDFQATWADGNSSDVDVNDEIEEPNGGEFEDEEERRIDEEKRRNGKD